MFRCSWTRSSECQRTGQSSHVQVRSDALAALLAIATAGCAATAPPGPREPVPPVTGSPSATLPVVAQPPPVRDSDSVADDFLKALQARDAARARALGDTAVKQALPEEKLAAIIDSQVAELGPLRSWRVVQRTQQGGKDVRVARLEFERGQLQALVAVDPKTLEVAGIFFTDVPAAASPAAYVDASKFREEAASVGAAPFVLPGTLSLPAGAGPFPGVVLVHGSGPNDRDETIAANKPFKDLAEGLASRGVSVLRYDKRTLTHGKRLTSGISLDEEVVVDAVAAVQLLRQRPEVDARRLYVIGHSLGALLAPEIALRAEPVAGAVLLAPPGRAPWDVVLGQMRHLELPREQLTAVEKTAEQFRAGRFEGELLGAPGSYWREWAARDGVAMSKKLHKPLLILRGDRDYQITEADLATWKKGLAGVRDVEISTIPGNNHLFIQGTGKPGPAEYTVPGHVDPAVIERIVSFVTQAR